MDKTIEKVNQNKTYNVETIYNSFFENLNSVKLYYNKFENLAIGEDEVIKVQSEKYFDNALDEMVLEMENAKKGKQEDYDFTPKASKIFLTKFARKLSKQPKISPKNYEILSRSSFLMLNNYFEYLLADLLSYYYVKFKNSLNAKELKITLKELSEFETVDEAIKDLILKEVESIIIEKKFNELLEHFESSLSISLEKDIINWEEIIEIRERRHLIVHNSSIVNKKYLVRTGNPFNFKVGDIINIDNEYFLKVWKNFKLSGELLVFNCWGNWDKDNIDKAIYEILGQVFDDLKSKDYDLVFKTCKYSEQIEPRNADQEDYLLRIKMNELIALKKLNQDKEFKNKIKKIRIGTASPIFKISYNILIDNYSNLEELFKQAIILNELNIDYYLDWPIFDFVRDKEEINKVLLNTFKLET